MGAAARTSIERVGLPVGLLIAAIALVVTLGRIGLFPLLAGRREELGTVRMYVENGGFGLVTRDSDGADVFVHRSALERRDGRLRVGDRVRFKVAPGNIRDMATRVRPVAPES